VRRILFTLCPDEKSDANIAVDISTIGNAFDRRDPFALLFLRLLVHFISAGLGSEVVIYLIAWEMICNSASLHLCHVDSPGACGCIARKK
jgi:hypothetical protein